MLCQWSVYPLPYPTNIIDLERDRPQGSAAHSDTSDNGKDDKLEAADLFKLILASVSTENIAGLRKGLTKQTLYWAGVAWVAEALEQRIQGIGASEIDLAVVTEKLASVSSIPDAGVLHRSESLGDGG